MTAFPKTSAFGPDPRANPDPRESPDPRTQVRELFRGTEKTIQKEEDRHFSSVLNTELEDWYRRLDELVRRFDVPREHVVSGHHVATASEDLERLRDEVYRHLR